MSLKKLLMELGYDKTHSVSSEERAAGIEAKLSKIMVPKGYWRCLVNVGMIFKDDYQRNHDKSHSKKLSDSGWDLRYASTPVCSCRNDSPMECHRGKGLVVFVDDGQHGLDVMKMKGDAREIRPGVFVIECLVTFEMSYKEASLGYNARNSNQKKLETWNKFDSAYKGGRDHENTVMQMARDYKLTTPIDVPPTAKADLHFPDRYLRILRNRGVAFLETMFKLQANCWKGQKHGITFYRALEGVIKDFDLKATREVIKALQSGTLIEDLHKVAMDYAKCKNQKPNEPVWRQAIIDHLHAQKVIDPMAQPKVIKATPKLRKAA